MNKFGRIIVYLISVTLSWRFCTQRWVVGPVFAPEKSLAEISFVCNINYIFFTIALWQGIYLKLLKIKLDNPHHD